MLHPSCDHIVFVELLMVTSRWRQIRLVGLDWQGPEQTVEEASNGADSIDNNLKHCNNGETEEKPKF